MVPSVCYAREFDPLGDQPLAWRHADFVAEAKVGTRCDGLRRIRHSRVYRSAVNEADLVLIQKEIRFRV